MRRASILAILVIGVGLFLAPFAFRMFSRAPQGGAMIDDFRPYMQAGVIDGFRRHLDRVDAAVTEIDGTLPALTAAQFDMDAATFTETFAGLGQLSEAWPAIDRSMNGMLDTIDANIDNYRAVDALPPFALFPWFFVVPGAVLIGLSVAALRSADISSRLRTALVALGVGLIAAPAIFQMFTRAPLGAAMIDDFRPMMRTGNITTIQGYFLTLGAGEGALRTDLLPRLRDAGMTDAEIAEHAPGVTAFVEGWPTMSNEMAPMMGAMNDNLDSFAGIDALPPFDYFPWFFVVPGVLVAGLGWWAGRRPIVEADAVVGVSPGRPTSV